MRQTETRHMPTTEDSAASAVVALPTVLPPPPYPPPAALSAVAKEVVRMIGLPNTIDPTKPPKNFKDASSRSDAKEWREAYFKEYQGMMDRGAVKAVKPPQGAKILGTSTRQEYKSETQCMVRGF